MHRPSETWASLRGNIPGLSPFPDHIAKRLDFPFVRMETDLPVLEKLLSLEPCGGTMGNLHVEARAVLTSGPLFPYQWGDERPALGCALDPSRAEDGAELHFKAPKEVDSRKSLLEVVEKWSNGRAVARWLRETERWYRTRTCDNHLRPWSSWYTRPLQFRTGSTQKLVVPLPEWWPSFEVPHRIYVPLPAVATYLEGQLARDHPLAWLCLMSAGFLTWLAAG